MRRERYSVGKVDLLKTRIEIMPVEDVYDVHSRIGRDPIEEGEVLRELQIYVLVAEETAWAETDNSGDPATD